MSWVPLESNPEVMNKYMTSLGVSDDYCMVDVFGLEPDLLMMVPRPVAAVMLLFPTNDKYEEHSKQQAAEIEEKGQEISENLFYVKQTISNACGTIAIIHSIANNMDKITMTDGHLKKYIDEARPLDADKRGELLLKAEGIANTHQESAQEGQSEPPPPTQPVNFHFVSFIHCDGGLYELDGRKSFPVRHGNTTPDTLLEDAAAICRDYIARDPDNLNFTVVALAANN